MTFEKSSRATLISKTLENFVSISTFYRHLGDFLFSQLPVFFMKVTMNGKISLVEGMRKHRNDEEQVSRTDLASKDSVLHTVEIIPGNNDVECITYCFLSFPVITIAVTYRCMLQCLGEQCIKWWKATKLKLCGQRKRSLHHRSSPSDSPASDQGKHQGYLTGCSTTWVLKKTVRMNIGQRHIWKDVKQAQWNQLWGADDLVKIVFIGEPTINNGEQGESASKVCLFAPSINYKT